MLTVISFKICPFVQRVTALLEAKQIPYQVDYISLSDKPKWFLDISPNAQVPLLVTESGTVLFESDAIVEYLEEAYPALQPDTEPEQRALDRAWSYLASKNYLVQCSAQRSPNQAALVERRAKMDSAFSRVEQALGDGPYFNGDSLSMVDIAWLPLLHRAALIERHSGYDFLSGFSKVKLWQQALLATGLAEKSVSEDFDQRFSDFYLSDQTLLGRGDNCDSDQSDQACANSSCC